jgi:hypothetical protein
VPKDEILTRLTLLEATAEIEELTARYAWHAARAEVKEMVDLFTSDGCFQSESGIMRGAKNLH